MVKGRRCHTWKAWGDVGLNAVVGHILQYGMAMPGVEVGNAVQQSSELSVGWIAAPLGVERPEDLDRLYHDNESRYCELS